jgi:hypothetical protein
MRLRKVPDAILPSGKIAESPIALATVSASLRASSLSLGGDQRLVEDIVPQLRRKMRHQSGKRLCARIRIADSSDNGQRLVDQLRWQMRRQIGKRS